MQAKPVMVMAAVPASGKQTCVPKPGRKRQLFAEMALAGGQKKAQHGSTGTDENQTGISKKPVKPALCFPVSLMVPIVQDHALNGQLTGRYTSGSEFFAL